MVLFEYSENAHLIKLYKFNISLHSSLQVRKLPGVPISTSSLWTPESRCSLQRALCWDKWTRYETVCHTEDLHVNVEPQQVSVTRCTLDTAHRKASDWDLHRRPPTWNCLLRRWDSLVFLFIHWGVFQELSHNIYQNLINKDRTRIIGREISHDLSQKENTYPRTVLLHTYYYYINAILLLLFYCYFARNFSLFWPLGL